MSEVASERVSERASNKRDRERERERERESIDLFIPRDIYSNPIGNLIPL